jgi:YVTN family beta-propeller protein
MFRAIIAALCFTLLAATTAQAGGSILVMNSGAASLSVLDIDSQTELSKIPVLREPHHWSLTPDRRELLVGDTVANEMLFLDPVSFAIRRRMPISDPYQLGFSPDGKFLVVTALARAQVDVYEAGSYKLVKRFALKSMPSHLAYSPDSAMVFITLQGTGRLAAIDLRKMAMAWDVPVGRAPAGLIWQNDRVLVANMGSDDVAEVDPRDGRVIERLKIGKGVHQLFRSPDGKQLWVNSRIDSTVTVLDATTLKVICTYKLPGGPDDLVFAPDGHVWFTLRFVHKVAVLDPPSGNFTTIAVGRSPHGIFLNPQAHPAK